jgi:hypothetical protein
MGRFNGGLFGCYMRGPGDLTTAGPWVVGANRWACSTGRFVSLGGVSNTAASATTLDAFSDIGIGSSGGFGAPIDGIYSRVCLDSDPTRCR